MSAIRNSRLLTLMLGHFALDSYVGLLAVLYPLLIGRFHINLATVGLVSLAYSGVGAISQPGFGLLADRYGTRFTGLALAWTGLVFAGVAIAPSFPVLVVLAGLAGLGSGCFHPLGAMNVGALLPDRYRNTGMSVYVTGGTIGVALGPLIGVVLFAAFGMRGILVTVLPVLSIAGFLLWQLRSMPDEHSRRQAAVGVRPPAIPMLPLAIVILVMMSRNWTVVTLEAFVPTWYSQLGYAAAFYGPLATTIVLASAFGTVGSGSLADRFGRRAVIFGSLVLSVPSILLFAQFTGPVAFLTGALVGFLAASTGPLMLVMAQQLMAGRTGLASGLVLGLAFVTGAIGVPVTGAIADHIGLQDAMRLQVVVVLVTLTFAWLLPSERFLRELKGSREASAAAALHLKIPSPLAGEG